MLPSLLLGCFQLSEPFHSDGGFLEPSSALTECDDPDCFDPDSTDPDSPDANTHYVSLGGVEATSLQFEGSESSWLAQYSAMGMPWSLSLTLPVGIPDPAEDTLNEFIGWNFLDTADFWLGINIHGCTIYGASSSQGELQSCIESSGTIAIGEQLTLGFIPQPDGTAIKVLVYLNGELLGEPIVSMKATPSQTPTVQLGGFNTLGESLGVAAPTIAIDQLIFSPMLIDEETLSILQETDNSELINDLVLENAGQFFSLGEHPDNCPMIREYNNPDGIVGELRSTNCDLAFVPN